MLQHACVLILRFGVPVAAAVAGVVLGAFWRAGHAVYHPVRDGVRDRLPLYDDAGRLVSQPLYYGMRLRRTRMPPRVRGHIDIPIIHQVTHVGWLLPPPSHRVLRAVWFACALSTVLSRVAYVLDARRVVLCCGMFPARRCATMRRVTCLVSCDFLL